MVKPKNTASATSDLARRRDGWWVAHALSCIPEWNVLFGSIADGTDCVQMGIIVRET